MTTIGIHSIFLGEGLRSHTRRTTARFRRSAVAMLAQPKATMRPAGRNGDWPFLVPSPPERIQDDVDAVAPGEPS